MEETVDAAARRGRVCGSVKAIRALRGGEQERNSEVVCEKGEGGVGGGCSSMFFVKKVLP